MKPTSYVLQAARLLLVVAAVVCGCSTFKASGRGSPDPAEIEQNKDALNVLYRINQRESLLNNRPAIAAERRKLESRIMDMASELHVPLESARPAEQPSELRGSYIAAVMLLEQAQNRVTNTHLHALISEALPRIRAHQRELASE